MDTKNRIFFWVFGLLILGSVTAAFLKYFIFLDYVIQAEIDCDPETENCYVYICNPKEEECTGDPEEDTWYYKIINKKAFNFPNCDPNADENCVIDCYPGEEDCEIELCNPEDPVSGQECMTPEKYDLLPKDEGVEEMGGEETEAEESAEATEENTENIEEPEENSGEVAGESAPEEASGENSGESLLPEEESQVVPN